MYPCHTAFTVIALRNKNEQNVISYSQIKKIESISCEEI